MWRQPFSPLAGSFRACRRLTSNAGPKKPNVVLSGIQPTGIPHLGNYLGALKQWVKFQETFASDDALLYSLVDLHAITLPQKSAELRQWRKESLASLLAIGLDPKRSVIFYQSDVPAHSELMWILSCSASMGYLSRMTQWKSKLALPDNAKPLDTPLQLGLFSYPVLMAADILVHGATHVPVGEDQSQHLEFTRNCATSFNHIYGNIFTLPETILPRAKRVMSLTQPATKKMSKSDSNPKSCILLTDSSDTIRRKIKAAVTDSHPGVSYDPENRPELASLINLMYYMSGDAKSGSPEDLVSECTSKSALKDVVTKVLDAHIAPIRERYELFMTQERFMDDIVSEGAARARESADQKMAQVREALGLR